MLDALLDTIGRFHPMAVHLPVGLLVALAAWECWRAVVLRRAGARVGEAPETRPHASMQVPVFLCWLAVLGAAGAIGTGLLHEREVGDDATTDLHKWLGIGAGVGALVTAVAATLARSGVGPIATAYRVVLLITVAGLIPAGHLGGTITHGEGYLFERLLASDAPAPVDVPVGVPVTPVPSVSADALGVRARQVLAANCESCHGPARARNSLRVDSIEGLLGGGRRGPAIVPGDHAASLLVERMRLPLEARGHMPPRDEVQPTAEDIEAIEAWIASLTPVAAEPG
ncbi:MAG: c-type cytochrome domain-containing protein [Phycisphaerales bacterium]